MYGELPREINLADHSFYWKPFHLGFDSKRHVFFFFLVYWNILWKLKGNQSVNVQHQSLVSLLGWSCGCALMSINALCSNNSSSLIKNLFLHLRRMSQREERNIADDSYCWSFLPFCLICLIAKNIFPCF